MPAPPSKPFEFALGEAGKSVHERYTTREAPPLACGTERPRVWFPAEAWESNPSFILWQAARSHPISSGVGPLDAASPSVGADSTIPAGQVPSLAAPPTRQDRGSAASQRFPIKKVGVQRSADRLGHQAAVSSDEPAAPAGGAADPAFSALSMTLAAAGWNPASMAASAVKSSGHFSLSASGRFCSQASIW